MPCILPKALWYHPNVAHAEIGRIVLSSIGESGAKVNGPARCRSQRDTPDPAGLANRLRRVARSARTAPLRQKHLRPAPLSGKLGYVVDSTWHETTGPVAQRQSRGLIIPWSLVRIQPGPIHHLAAGHKLPGVSILIAAMEGSVLFKNRTATAPSHMRGSVLRRHRETIIPKTHVHRMPANARRLLVLWTRRVDAAVFCRRTGFRIMRRL